MNIHHSINKLTHALTVTALGVATLSAQPSENTVRIGYQKSSNFLFVRARGELDARLKAKGIAVEWREFTSGPPLLAALSGGSLDFGETCDAPGVFAQAADAPIKYVAHAKASPRSVALLLPEKSKIKKVAKLKGKKIAYAQDSSGHYFLAKLLHDHGLAFGDIQSVLLQPADALVALKSGTVDGWAIWDPPYASGEIKAKARVLKDSVGVVPFYGYYLATDKYLASNPESLPIILEELNAIEPWVKKYPRESLRQLEEGLGLDPDVAKLYQERKERYNALPLSDGVIASQQAIADLFFKAGLLKKEVSVSEYVWKKP
ncbi:MAG: aliphatic sulfonate ABC transporter substrate-binding protein [Verrucomicrobiales bacterium]|jgi:sulfonate transport system substrate-binding protein|nr:aliphatic sulfonate ABC transporter substrate-binding protein [Verrucomicrobiales bacterium]